MINKKFDINHIDVMCLKLNYPCLNTLKSEVYTFYDEGERAKTFMKDGRIIFACGIKIDRKGVGRCWVIPSIYVNKYKISVVKTVRELLETNAKQMGLHRVHTTITPAFTKWIELMGFEKEAIFKQFNSDKSDEHLYVRFF